MDEIPTSQEFYDYRGERFRLQSAEDDAVFLWVDGDPTVERFPDALEFGADRGEPWVMLPRNVLGSMYEQKAYGRWRGVPVAVVSTIKLGSDRGKVVLNYAGTRPGEATAAGFSGDQYNGWSVRVPPSEVEDVTVETTEHPRVR
jgi:hypothetical protein